MRPVPAALASLALLAGCAVGPRYRPPEPAPGVRAVTAPPSAAAPLLDSLARAVAVPAPVPVVPPFEAQASDAVAWLEILKDTTLVSLVRTALRDNRDLRASLARVREFRAASRAAWGSLLPRIDGAASAGTSQIAFGAFPPQSFDAYRVSADLQWELDFWGRARRGIGAARADLTAREEDRRAEVLSLVANVATAYLELLELRENLAVAQQTLVSREATLRLARQRFAQGVISELDVRQFEAEVASPAIRVAEFQRALSQKEHELSLLLGRPPARLEGAGALDVAVAAVAVPDSVSAALLARRPDVRRADRELAAATARIGEAQGARLPQVSLTGQFGSQSQLSGELFRRDSEIYAIQAGVSIPLFHGGRLAADVAAARARAEQSRARYEQTVLTAMREAADAMVGVRSTRDQLAAQTAQAVALREALRLAERRYEGGVASYLEVLDAQRGLFAAELLLNQTQRAYLASSVQLYKALGGRWDGGEGR